MTDASWPLWLMRFCITIVSTAVVAWGISFKVADYVVRANTTGNLETMRALQSSIERLNESVIANSGRLDAFTANMTTLMVRSATTATEIAALREDMGRVQSAVQGAGIDIRIGNQAEGKLLDWSILREVYGVDATAPLYLEVGAPRE